MARIVGQQLRVTSWRFVCVTKHLELPNIAIQLELLAVFPSFFFFSSSPYINNKGKVIS